MRMAGGKDACSVGGKLDVCEIELNWVELSWVELNWVELSWVELNWIELINLGFSVRGLFLRFFRDLSRERIKRGPREGRERVEWGCTGGTAKRKTAYKKKVMDGHVGLSCPVESTLRYERWSARAKGMDGSMLRAVVLSVFRLPFALRNPFDGIRAMGLDVPTMNS